MLSTLHRRNVLDYIGHTAYPTYSSLKKRFVDSLEMNQTTLYRILERFCQEGLIHRAEFGGEKFFIMCQCHDKKQDTAIQLKCCVNCHHIEEKHTSLPMQSLSSETIELVKHCEKCEK